MTQMKITKRTFDSLNKNALAGNEAHLSVMIKMVSFSNNAHLDMGLQFSLHTVQLGRWHTGTSIRNAVSKFLQCWWRGYIHSLLDVSHRKKSQWVQVRWTWRPLYVTTYTMICCWNASIKNCWTLHTLCGGSVVFEPWVPKANSLQNWVLHPPDVPSIGIPLTCPRKTRPIQSVYFLYIPHQTFSDQRISCRTSIAHLGFSSAQESMFCWLHEKHASSVRLISARNVGWICNQFMMKLKKT